MKRKLITLISAVIIAILLNFTLWFLHTRTITNFVENVQKELGLKGVFVEYKDLRFTNFLGWRVKASLNDIVIRKGPVQYRTIHKIEKIYISSQPLQNKIDFDLMGDIITQSTTMSYEQEFATRFINMPHLEVKLSKSLSSWTKDLNAYQSRPFMELEYFALSNTAADIYDVKNGNQKFLSIDDIVLKLADDSDKDARNIKISFDMPRIIYNEDYKVANSILQQIHNHSVKLGEISLSGDMIYKELSSQHALEALAQKFGDKVDISQLNKPYDTVILNVQNFDLKSALFKLKLSGLIERQPFDPIPYLNLRLMLQNYPNIIDYYIGLLNVTIDSIAMGATILPIKKISDEQSNELVNIIKSLAPKNESSSAALEESDDIILDIVRNEEKTTISNVPIADIMQRLQALFFSGITPQFPMNEGSDTRQKK